MNVAIIGSGIVGQATGRGLTIKGNQVKFYDIDKQKLSALRSEGYDATDNLDDAISEAKVVFVCVPTPTVKGRIDFRYIDDCTKAMAKVLRSANNYKVISFRSTIPPQTTRTKLIPMMNRYCGSLKCGRDFGVCMNPEFLREKSPLDDFLNPSRIVIGSYDEKSSDILNRIYSTFNCPIINTDLDTAEMIKYVSNIFLASKISFFNEMFLFSQELKLNPKTISLAVSLDPRIGDYGIDGGKPFGGMCLPKDLTAFLHFARLKRFNPVILEAVAKVNEKIDQYCVSQQSFNLKYSQVEEQEKNLAL